MSKYLILNQPPAPVPKGADVKGCVNYFLELHVRGKARIYPVVGMKGYATFVDVESHQELINLLKGNPMGHIERYKVFPLGNIDEMKH